MKLTPQDTSPPVALLEHVGQQFGATIALRDISLAIPARRMVGLIGPHGVGKSSLLNALDTSFGIATGAVSERLGRGKHTTRHVELYALGEDTFVADTPGFASFEVDMVDPISCENLQYAFREFRPYIGKCRFRDCAHLKEPGCAVLAAVEAGEIAPERHESYARLYALSAQVCDWEKKK